MPALELFGRRWHVASDDVCIPASLGLLFHACWMVVNAVALAQLEDPFGCHEARRYAAYFVALLACRAGSMLTEGGAIWVSLRGTMLDAGRRRAMGPLLYASLFSYVLTVGVNLYGTLVVYYPDKSGPTCIVTGSGWSNRKVVLALVWAEWAVIIMLALGLLLVFNLFPESSNVDAWEGRCRCLNAIFCCWTGRSHEGGGRHARAPPASGSVPPGNGTFSHYAPLGRDSPSRLGGDGGTGRTNKVTAAGAADVTDVEAGTLSSPEVALKAAELEEVDRRHESDSPLVRLAALCTLFFGTSDLTLSDFTTAVTLVGVQQRLDRQRQSSGAPARPRRRLRLFRQSLEGSEYDLRGDPAAAAVGAGGGSRNGAAHTIVDINAGGASSSSASSRGGSTHQRWSASGGVAPQAGRGGTIAMTTLSGDRACYSADAGKGLPLVSLGGVPTGSGRPAPFSGGADAAAHAPAGDGAAKRGGEDCGTGPVPFEVLADAEHYFRFALGSYGWAMYVWANRGRGHKCFRLCLACCTCCTFKAAQRRPVRSKGIELSKRFTVEAILSFTHLPPEDLLYVSHENAVAGFVPYFIAADTKRREIILAIRGSMSVEDCVTDLLCEPSVLPPVWLAGSPELLVVGAAGFTSANAPAPPPTQRAERSSPGSAGDGAAAAAGGGRTATTSGVEETSGAGPGDANPALFVHDGILKCAEAVLADLHRHGVLASVLSNDFSQQAKRKHPGPHRDCRGWKVVVVGHSLGAGVAALLTLHMQASAVAAAAAPAAATELRGTQAIAAAAEAAEAAEVGPLSAAASQLISVRCWAFAPPGGLMSRELADLLRPTCTSIVTGRDMIPRLSIRNMYMLSEQLLDAASRVRVSKTAVWLRTAVLGYKWTEAQLFMAPEDIPPPVLALMDAYRGRLALGAAAALVSRLRPAEDFVAPGTIVYLESFKVPVSATSAKWYNLLASLKPAMEVVYRPRWMGADELATGGVMVTRHMFSSHVPDFQQDVIKEVVRTARAARAQL